MAEASTNETSKTGVSTEAPPVMRKFGRFELRALLNKSQRTMMWLVFDPRGGQELILCIPRQAPQGPGALEQWQRTVNAVARVQHPQIAPVLEVGQVEHWPYAAYDRANGETLDERLARSPAALPIEAADWIAQYLLGLAFAHEAGHVHGDVQCASLLIDANNKVRVVGLEVGQDLRQFAANPQTLTPVAARAQRELAEEDVLCVGLVLHRILTGKRVIDHADNAEILALMQPHGNEIVRLGWETPHPIPDPLRAIANRSTDRQPRQRYHSARTLLRALEGWKAAAASDDGGPLGLLMDKLQRVGHLPTTTTALNHVAHASSGFAAQHTAALSELILKDMALTLELVRRVNNSLKQNGSVSGTVLNMQRAVAMLGLEGVEAGARSLKPWPGPLNPSAAESLGTLMRRVNRAGQIAQFLRPAGYDAEVVYLITVLQNFGRLLVSYHFPDDAIQIQQLQVPPEPTPDMPHPPTLSEQAAAYAVMGCDLESLGAAVVRHWALGDEMLHMMRRQAPEAPVRSAGTDADALRLTCSLANELVDASNLPAQRQQAAIDLATRRYARVLGLGQREVHAALNPEHAASPSGDMPQRGNEPVRPSTLRAKVGSQGSEGR
ncbi:MAG: HDOD domain-containing protein [Paucibacter sp.]|nr:HDOD domain-containing protein [Roseateles sp.]